MMSEKNQLILQWVKVGIVCGILGDICYGLAISVPMPDILTNVVFWSFGPLLIAGSPCIYFFIKQHRNSVPLQIGTIFLALAGFSMTIMSVLQRAVFQTFLPIRPDSADTVAYEAWRMGLASGNAIQLGMDIVWDIFILVSAILLAISMYSHPKLGKIISVIGILIGLAGLFFNLSTFPVPPGQAGSYDIGPAAGFWFLAVMIMVIVNFKWFKRSLEETSSAAVAT